MQDDSVARSLFDWRDWGNWQVLTVFVRVLSVYHLAIKQSWHHDSPMIPHCSFSQYCAAACCKASATSSLIMVGSMTSASGPKDSNHRFTSNHPDVFNSMRIEPSGFSVMLCSRPHCRSLTYRAQVAENLILKIVGSSKMMLNAPSR